MAIISIPAITHVKARCLGSRLRQCETSQPKAKPGFCDHFQEAMEQVDQAYLQKMFTNRPSWKLTGTATGKKETASIPSRERAADTKILSVAEEDVDGDSNLNEDESTGSKPPLNSISTTYNKADFELPRLDAKDKNIACRYNLKISSWNVSSLTVWLKKDGLIFLKYAETDIFYMQEIKCTIDQLPEELERLPDIHIQTVTPEEMELVGVNMKKAEDVTIEREFEKIKKFDIENWENIRGPIP
uniref:Uncharacterized protein n=1 Tax=Glossina palpalis gambiensis TaxID=67801 RepID=A0A1B0BP32_9MUSC